MGRKIVNTGGQGLASSDAVKFAIGSIVVAAVVLLVFFFLNSATKSRAAQAAATFPAVTVALAAT